MPAGIVQQAFLREGVHLVLSTKVIRVGRTTAGKTLHFDAGNGPEHVEVDEILLGAGRVPNVDGLGLETAGVQQDGRGVTVDDQLRTTNRRIYAAGDICMEYKFTHAADAGARVAVQNALFLGRKRLSALTIPWCTFTDPEIAHIGLYERDAMARGIAMDTYVRELKDVDRAIADGEEEGFVIPGKGRIRSSELRSWRATPAR
jgi:pyruvate/2-oxoglutarate dehydrogenase complex dihydrolipoamide dehydrogenase (E3) component